MTVAVENFRLSAALSYAAMGWRVFPIHHPMLQPQSARCSCGEADCSSPGKHPRTPNGLHDADSDPDIIRAWWERWPAANVGIVTGQVSGVYVVDIDPGKDGETSWQELIQAYGEIPVTATVETGGGGTHIFFRAPTKTMRNTAGRLGPGIDTRGDGGYVVAAPSLHISGTRYSWRNDPSQFQPIDMPAWLLALLTDAPKQNGASVPTMRGGEAQYWLGRALGIANVGNRNQTGFWLAQQLRDAKIGEGEAEVTLRAFAQRTPSGDSPYTEREALASLRSAYSQPAREPARRESMQSRQQAPAKPTPIPTGAASELGEFLEGIMGGEISAAAWPWQKMTRFTQALIPGTTTVIVGDPGVGKTFLILECLQHWEAKGVDAACYFIEKNRRFHMMRLLAQLEGDSRFLDYDWIVRQPSETCAAMDRHRATIDRIGKHVYSSNGERVTMDSVLNWVRQMASMGRRIILVDPITAVDAGIDRWTKDDQFMLTAEHVASEHGASLVFVTHPKKGNRPGAPTGHDTAGGAAYYRLCDTLIWVNKPRKPRRVRCFGSTGSFITTPHLFFQIHKARNGKGTGQEIAFNFGEGLKFAEQGVVEAEVKETDVDQL